MRPPPSDHLCLSCKQAKATITGLCPRCYGRYRYHTRISKKADVSSLSIACDIELSVKSKTLMNLLTYSDDMKPCICERCFVMMEKGGILTDSGSDKQQMFICPSCGISSFRKIHQRPQEKF